MSSWESMGASDEWYTPKYIFDALGCVFDIDVSGPSQGEGFVPALSSITLPQNGLSEHWHGFIWMNPPFGGRNGLIPWLDRFFEHGNGISLTPDRTSAPWWQDAAKKADAILFISGKVKFIRPDGTEGKSPSTGTCLFASGARGVAALKSAHKNGLGYLSL